MIQFLNPAKIIFYFFYSSEQLFGLERMSIEIKSWTENLAKINLQTELAVLSRSEIIAKFAK